MRTKANLTLKRTDGDYDIIEGYILAPAWGAAHMLKELKHGYALIHLPTASLAGDWRAALETMEIVVEFLESMPMDWQSIRDNDNAIDTDIAAQVVEFVHQLAAKGELSPL